MTGSPRERIARDITAALRAGDKERLSTLRMVLAEIQNESIQRGDTLDEEGFIALLRRGLKQRREAAEAYRQGGREESAAQEEREASILEEYLPEQASEAELEEAVRAFVQEHDLSGPGAIRQVMGAMTKRFAGRADNALLARLAREILT